MKKLGRPKTLPKEMIIKQISFKKETYDKINLLCNGSGNQSRTGMIRFLLDYAIYNLMNEELDEELQFIYETIKNNI